MAEGADFSRHIEVVAMAMLQAPYGEPNRALSTPGKELRFGKKGSLSVDLVKGTWHDHSNQEGGGTLDLLKLYGDMDQAEALDWMVQQGLIEPTKRGDRKNEGKFLGFMEHHPEKTFVYHDDKGRVAYEVLKFPKDAPRRYMQRRPAPGGGWVFGLQAATYGKTRDGNWFKAKEGKRYEDERAFDDAPRFLFHLAAVKKAIAAGTPIMLVEGEKDVETIEAWGMVATTNAGGAKYWTDGMTEALTGAHVVLCSDNDEPGRTRTLMLGAQLRAVAKSVRVLDLARHWQDMPEKADVSDWRDQAGGTKEKFGKLVEKAPVWQPSAPKSKFGAISWADMDADAPEFAYLIDGWLPLDGRSVMGGPSQAGKSFLAMHLGLCVARGEPFLGNTVERRGVYYQAGEGGSGAKKRILAYRQHYGVTGEDDVPFVFAPAKVDLFARDGDTAALIEDIKAQALMMSAPLGLVVIDTLATATAGADENSGKDMSVVLANIARIEKECRCHVMLVHHMNAEGKKLRGHTSIFADVDTVITILNDETTKVRTATLSKQKDDETGIKLHFELMAVKVGFNPRTAKDITSCVVLPKGEKDMLKAEQERQGFSPNQTERRILINLFEAIRRHGRPIADERDGPVQAIGRTVVTYEQFRDVSLERMVDIEDRKKAVEQIRKEFARSRDMMVKHNVIGAHRGGDDPKDSYVWWGGRPVRGFRDTFPRKDPAANVWQGRQEEEQASYSSPGLDEVMTDPEIPF